MSVVSINTTEHYTWGERCHGWHLAKTPGLSVIQEKVPYGSFEARHYHECAEQFFYVLSGTATVEVAEIVYQLRSGDGVHVAAGMPHKLSNEQPEDLVFLVVSSPPSHGDRVLA